MRANTAVVMLIALTSLGACAGGPEDGEPTGVPSDALLFEGLRYHAGTNVMESFPVQLATTVTVANTGDSRIDVVFPDGCVALLRAYDDSTRTGRPVWDQRYVTGCTMALVERRLAPGVVANFRTGADAREILGDSLPDGHYWLSVFLRPNQDSIEVAAGEADLAVPR